MGSSKKPSTKQSAPAGKRAQVVAAVKPWSSEASWWVMAIEAVVAIGLGVYTLIQPLQAGAWLTFILGLFLLADGFLSLFTGLRGTGGRLFHMASSGVAILAGLLVLLMPVLNFGDTQTQAWIIGIAFILVGIFGLLAVFFERHGRIRWMRALIMLLVLAIGVSYVYSLATKNPQILTAVGWILLAIGVMLGVFAAFVWSQQRKAPTAAAVAPAANKSSAPTVPAASAAKPAAATAAPKKPAAPASIQAKSNIASAANTTGRNDGASGGNNSTPT